jgi:hypothetical protein
MTIEYRCYETIKAAMVIAIAKVSVVGIIIGIILELKDFTKKSSCFLF